MSAEPQILRPVPIQTHAYVDVEDLTCPICCELPENEVYQCREGHLLCANCYIKISKCSECRVPLPPKGIRVRAVEKMLDAVPYKCPHHKVGCKVTMGRKDLASHLKICTFTPVKVCQAVGMFDCDFQPDSGDSLWKHLEAKHKVQVLTDVNNVIQFTDFAFGETDSASVYLYKETTGEKRKFLIYRELQPTTCSAHRLEEKVAVSCFNLEDTSSKLKQEAVALSETVSSVTNDLEDYRFTINFTFNYGSKEILLKTVGPITHYLKIESVITGGPSSESGFEIPLKFLKTQANNPRSTQQGENYVEFNFSNLVCEPCTVDLTQSPSS